MKYVTLKDVVNDDKYPFTKGQLHYLLLNRKTNGLASSVRKIGKRIYLRDDLFLKWIESFSEKKTDKEENIEQFVNIEDLEFSIRTTNCLYYADIKTIEDLLNKTESELRMSRNMCKFSITEIKKKLASLDLTLMEE